MTDRFEEALLKSWPLRPGTEYKAVAAVSGGADSTALLVGLASLRRHFGQQMGLSGVTVVHVHHALRGAEADADAEFVERTARRLGLPYRLARLDPRRLRRRIPLEGGLESAARAMRYEALAERAEMIGARYILTAHQRQDVLETLLQRLFRGSALSGLTGIAPLRPLNEAVVLVRPMLGLTREEILDYLARKNETYRVDSSNRSALFTRNRIRGELIPLLESIFPQKWDASLRRFSRLAAELVPMIDRQVDALAEELARRGPITVREDRIILPIEALVRGEVCPGDYVLRDLFRRLWTRQNWPLRDMSARHWERLAAMARGEGSDAADFPGRVTARRGAETLTLTRSADDTEQAGDNRRAGG